MKKLSIEQMENVEGGAAAGCDVTYQFNGDVKEFEKVLHALEDRGYTGQLRHLANLYNSGCIVLAS